MVLLGVPGRDPNPGPGVARLVEEPLFAPNRDPNPGAGAARLVEDRFCAPNRDAKPGAGAARLVDEPLFAPKRVRMFISEACGLRMLAWLPRRAGPRVVKSNMLAAAMLWVSWLAYRALLPGADWGVPARDTDRMLPLTTPCCLTFWPKNWPSPRAFWSMRFGCCGWFSWADDFLCDQRFAGVPSNWLARALTSSCPQP